MYRGYKDRKVPDPHAPPMSQSPLQIKNVSFIMIV